MGAEGQPERLDGFRAQRREGDDDVVRATAQHQRSSKLQRVGGAVRIGALRCL